MTILQKRSFTIAGHRTSVALEPDFWVVLRQGAEAAGQNLPQLVAEADRERSEGQGLASRLRILALEIALRRS